MKKLLLATLLGAMTLTSVSVMAAEDVPYPHLETVGRGEISVQPDMAIFSVGVVETKATAEAAKAAVDSAVSALLARLTAQGVSKENIESANLSLYPQYDYPKNAQPKLVGYKASRTVMVTVDHLNKLNVYLDQALSNGLNQVNNIEFKVRNEKKYQLEAREAAIKNAQEKAKSLAKGFGVKLSNIWNISYERQNSMPVMNYAMDARSVSYKNESYQDSAITIRDQVSVIYLLNK